MTTFCHSSCCPTNKGIQKINPTQLEDSKRPKKKVTQTQHICCMLSEYFFNKLLRKVFLRESLYGLQNNLKSKNLFSFLFLALNPLGGSDSVWGGSQKKGGGWKLNCLEGGGEEMLKIFLAAVLLSATVERFGASHMREFFRLSKLDSGNYLCESLLSLLSSNSDSSNLDSSNSDSINIDA